MGPRTDVIAFYGHATHKEGELAILSNFFNQRSWPGPFLFKVTLVFCACDISQAERQVMCDFSEKTIMICKAAACGDIRTYRAIAQAEQPEEAKRLGSYAGPLQGFDQAMWDRIDCSVAFQVAFQKNVNPELSKILFGRKGFFAEMTHRDSIWGTGKHREDDTANDPSTWPGCNMLGWAFSELRDLMGEAGPNSKAIESLRNAIADQEEKVENGGTGPIAGARETIAPPPAPLRGACSRGRQQDPAPPNNDLTRQDLKSRKPG